MERKTYGQIWEEFKQKNHTIPEHELRRLHTKWIKLAADAQYPSDGAK